MATHHLAQGHPQAWPWGMAMYTNLHYHHHQQQQQYYEREHLFEKPLTPSDVGKLNRLVIPKQHAERHFPLGGGGAGGDGNGNEKGLLLEFDDEAGRPWRFRYSYWVSSQSYVLTKGWSRYVKEKRLDAGDVVRFDRVRGAGAGAADRLFICCRRRGESAASAAAATPTPPPALNAGEQQQQPPWSPTVCYSTSGSSYPPSPASPPYAYHIDTPHAGAGAGEADAKSSGGTPTTGTAPTRKLRLFGVNLDCGPEPEPPTAAMYGYGYVHQSPYAAAVPAVPSYWGSS